MAQLSSKNDDSSLCYDVIITHQKLSPPQVWSLWRAVVLGNGAVEEAVVWQDLKLC